MTYRVHCLQPLSVDFEAKTFRIVLHCNDWREHVLVIGTADTTPTLGDGSPLPPELVDVVAGFVDWTLLGGAWRAA